MWSLKGGGGGLPDLAPCFMRGGGPEASSQCCVVFFCCILQLLKKVVKISDFPNFSQESALKVKCWVLASPPSLLRSSENLKIVNLQGRLKSNKKLASELSFNFSIESVGESTPSVTVGSSLKKPVFARMRAALSTPDLDWNKPVLGLESMHKNQSLFPCWKNANVPLFTKDFTFIFCC